MNIVEHRGHDCGPVPLPPPVAEETRPPRPAKKGFLYVLKNLENLIIACSCSCLVHVSHPTHTHTHTHTYTHDTRTPDHEGYETPTKTEEQEYSIYKIFEYKRQKGKLKFYLGMEHYRNLIR